MLQPRSCGKVFLIQCRQKKSTEKQTKQSLKVATCSKCECGMAAMTSIKAVLEVSVLHQHFVVVICVERAK